MSALQARMVMVLQARMVMALRACMVMVLQARMVMVLQARMLQARMVICRRMVWDPCVVAAECEILMIATKRKICGHCKV